jgi:hypothetical protein
MAMQCLFSSTIDDEWRHWLFHNTCRLLSFMFEYLDKLPPTKVHIFWYSGTAKPFCFFADMFGEIIHAHRLDLGTSRTGLDLGSTKVPLSQNGGSVPGTIRAAFDVTCPECHWKQVIVQNDPQEWSCNRFVYLQRDAHLTVCEVLPLSELNTTTGSLFLLIRSHRVLILQWREYCFNEHVASHFTLSSFSLTFNSICM